MFALLYLQQENHVKNSALERSLQWIGYAEIERTQLQKFTI